jgi:hypothetical protein
MGEQTKAASTLKQLFFNLYLNLPNGTNFSLLHKNFL